MKTLKIGLGLLTLLLAAGGWMIAGPGDGATEVQLVQWQGKLRVFEGVKEGIVEPAKVVTSSFLKYSFTANIESDQEVQAEQDQIKKIFNLKDVRLLTESDLSWKRGLPETVLQVFRLDHKEYRIRLTTPLTAASAPLRAEVFEQGEQGPTSLLDTEFNIPKSQTSAVVFGFENTQGQPYFLSLRILSEEAAVKAVGKVKPPKLVKQVNPVYPEEASKAGKEGIVILEATTDKTGHVVSARILRPVDPALDQAALDAVKQWAYEPMVINGRPQGITFTVTVRFRLDKNKAKGAVAGGVEAGVQGGVEGGVEGGVAGGVEKEEWGKKLDEFQKGAVRCEGEINPPKLIKEVPPVYPEDARQKQIEGTVILSARTDEFGRVADTFILRSIPALDEAARAAVKQWVYEPMVINGKAVPVVFTVTVHFQLK
jgi:TonB family protein